ncbi:helix-turn-helix domain-containing protein [Sorangium sp. So ce1024]|uniref:helix-turn-helix domain-containing protein n=1 Tax=Sorangium sp. So ce1024 TaxID=3133327 RepID=UPI003EFC7459
MADRKRQSKSKTSKTAWITNKEDTLPVDEPQARRANLQPKRVPATPLHSLTALGIEVQRRRHDLSLTQEYVAGKADVSRTAVALLEQGRRMPGPEALKRILTIVELNETPFAELAEPTEQLRLRFEQALGELVGRSAKLEHLDADSVAVARAAVESLFRRDKTSEQAYDSFSTALVFYDVAAPTRQFFEHYLGAEGVSSISRFETRVERFQKDAIRLFATFGEAYSALALADDFERHLAPLQPRPDEHYRHREAWDIIETIAPERLPDLGYISAARVRQEQDERQALSSFLMDLATRIESKGAPALNDSPEKKRRKMGSLLRKFASSLTHDFLSPLFTPDPDQLRREAARVAPKEEGELARIAETQAIGQRNLARYLAADHLDVYVATSMRTDADFASVNAFSESLFAHDDVRPLKLRYFNPTQSWIEDRVAKGLVEALMLRRADFTVYMAQKDDTFGKDSEASVALGQGKPVIVYVPRLFVPDAGIDSARIGAMTREDLLKQVQQEVPADEVDDTADAQALIAQIVSAKLNKADARTIASAAFEHWADFDLIGEARRIESEELRKGYRGWLDEIIKSRGNCPLPAVLRQPIVSILTALAANFEKRALVFREVHPLALQVILSSGVLNGILVARSVDACAKLLAQLVKNDLAVELLTDENNYRLVETSTRSTIRVISRNQLIVNAFAAHYRAKRRNS